MEWEENVNQEIEERDDRQETQVIKETVGTETEGEGMGKHEKRKRR